MPRGGAREGAGRKKSALTVKTQEIAKAVADEGVSPLEVMIGNMRFWSERAEHFTERLMRVAEQLKPSDVIEGSDCVREVLKLVEKVTLFRDRAQSCAEGAAPYIHPRLAAIAFSGDAKDELTQKITAQMAPKDAAAAYQAILGR